MHNIFIQEVKLHLYVLTVHTFRLWRFQFFVPYACTTPYKLGCSYEYLLISNYVGMDSWNCILQTAFKHKKTEPP